MPWTDVEYTTGLNYLSPVRLTLAALPAMLFYRLTATYGG